jgi:nucleotide-binding universal stress UspA family protein
MWSPAVKQARERAKPLAREYLERVAVRVGERGIPVQIVTVEGRPAVEITQYAEKNQVELIALSTLNAELGVNGGRLVIPNSRLIAAKTKILTPRDASQEQGAGSGQ